MRLKILFYTTLLVLPEMNAGYAATPTQSVSRQLTALRSMVVDFAKSVEDRVAALQTQVSALDDEVSAMRRCANSGLVYAPRSTHRDHRDCLAVGGDYLTRVDGADVIDTGLNHDVQYSPHHRAGIFRMSLDIYRYAILHETSNLIIEAGSTTRHFSWETGRDGNEDQHSATYTLPSAVRINDSWVDIPNEAHIQVFKNENLVTINGNVYQGKWDGRIYAGDNNKPRFYRYQ